MKKNLCHTFMLISLSILMSSCHKSSPSYSTEDSETMYFTGQGGSQRFTFYTNGNWQIESIDPWIQVSPQSGHAQGVVTVTCDQNEYKDIRWGGFLISVDEIVVAGIDVWQEVANITFDDANFKAFCLEYYDDNGDREINLGEASEITYLDICDQNIKSLEGIHAFTNLSELFCDDNQLTALYLSKNTKLKKLSCGNNKLTSLDVSKNTQLEGLFCDNNKLTSLDVSRNVELESLFCQNNLLTSLNVSKNTKLSSLKCYSNRLTTLDVSNNPNLFLYLNSLDCAPMETLKTLKLKEAGNYWYIYDPDYVPAHTSIVFVN